MVREEALAKAGSEGIRLQRAADAEALDNEQDLNRRRGDIVVYGQIVQILHRSSQRFIRTSSTTTSRREARFDRFHCAHAHALTVLGAHSHLRVDLHSETTKHSWFRIMPRYKVHAEGDRIRMNDQVPMHAYHYANLP